ncbi:MAG: DNA translocase FtsK 4TM domain-containing protein, partial [Bacteroidota bacterium]
MSEQEEEMPVNKLREKPKTDGDASQKESGKDSAEAKEPKKKRRSRRPTLAERFEPLMNFLRNEQVHRISGLFFILASVYMTVAFISFLFTWQTDQDKVAGPWPALFASDTEVSNWLGKLGAVISHVFIHQGFGIASFVFALVSFVLGVRLLIKTTLLPIGKTLAHGFFALLFFSVAFGYIFSDRW